jgi:ankyrin repeat protein
MSDELINKQNNDGATALHYAVKSGNIKVSKLLFNKMSPDVLDLKDKDGNTLLHYILSPNKIFVPEFEEMDLLKFFLPKMSKDIINATNKDGETIVHLALRKMDEKLFEFIINN